MEFMLDGEGFKTELEYGELHISGNENHGFRPYQLMVSSIAVCSGGVLKKILEKKRMTVSDLRISTEVVRNKEKANAIEVIHLHYKITGKNLDESKVAQSIKIASRNCPIARSVEGSIMIHETFEIST
ncbi:OsmC family peroxiredoxin [Bacillus lacus]|uniref:OsmC family peroxiredoxin n=1 Tax=Metabacillus lacus TaxID=1983721 RepID=A0A7X2M035_9BACI|nr:OsmC family peroxiredoxin [Metabacillus lacus]